MVASRFPVEAGHIMVFARSIGDPNPIYRDEEYAASSQIGHIIAPPTFIQAASQFDPAYRLRPTPGEPWIGSGRDPTGVPAGSPAASVGTGRGLHAEQHFEYHRHIRPGDVLHGVTRAGETWEKQGRRGGRLVFTENVVEYRDQSDELVITIRSVGVRTERPASG